MQLSRELTERLNELSLRYLGSKSKWRKLVEKGALVPATEEMVGTVTKEDGTTEEVKTRRPIRHHGSPVLRRVRPTPEMILAQFEAAEIARLKKLEEEKAQAMSNAVQEAAGGRA